MSCSSTSGQGAVTAAPAPADPELDALAAELMRDNPGMRRFEATNRAAALLDDMTEYAARWDANDLPISLMETPAPEGE